MFQKISSDNEGWQMYLIQRELYLELRVGIAMFQKYLDQQIVIMR